MKQQTSKITVRLDAKTEKILRDRAREENITVSDYIRQCVTGERNELDKMIKSRISAQVASINDNLEASAANINANISALREQIEEMQFRFYATWVFFSKPRKEIESVDNVLFEVENIAAEIMQQDKEMEAREKEKAQEEKLIAECKEYWESLTEEEQKALMEKLEAEERRNSGM